MRPWIQVDIQPASRGRLQVYLSHSSHGHSSPSRIIETPKIAEIERFMDNILGLARHAEQNGAVIHTKTEVIGIKKSGLRYYVGADDAR